MLKGSNLVVNLIRGVSRAATTISVPKMTPYALFIKENAKASTQPIRKETIGAFAKETSAKWKALSEMQKETYGVRSKQMNEKAIAEFNKKPEDEKKRLEMEARDAKTERLRKRELRERREHWEATGHPKIPLNAFARFVKEKFSGGKKATSIQEGSAKVKALAEEWKSMSDAQKSKWVKAAETDKQEYNRKVTDWKESQKNKDDKKKK